MNIYKSKYSGTEIEDILNKARVLCLEIGKTKWEELINAIDNNSPIFIRQDNSLVFSVLSYYQTKLFIDINYWDGKEYKEIKLGHNDNGDVIEFEYILPDNTIKIVIDKFINPEEGITTRQERAEYEGFSNWKDYLNWYLNGSEINDFSPSPIIYADTYHHTKETIDWEGIEYDVWISLPYNEESRVSYIITEKHDLDYFKKRSLLEDPNSEWCPFVAILDSDLNISDYNSDKIQLDYLVSASEEIKEEGSIRIWFDTFLQPSGKTKDIVAEGYWFSSWPKLVDTYIKDPIGQGANKYTYIDETIEWEGNTYYLWEDSLGAIGGDKYYVLTSTIDYEELYSKSLESNIYNEWCPYIVCLNEDLDLGYTAEDTKDILIKVDSDYNTLSIWVDDFPGYHAPLFHSKDDYDSWKEDESVFIELADNYIDTGYNQFDYTGQTYKYNDENYYLWKCSGECKNIGYILTSTIDIDFLKSKSLFYDPNSEYRPYVTTLDKNLKIVSNVSRNDWLLNVAKIYPIPSDVESNNTLRIWVDSFGDGVKEDLMDYYGYDTWEEFIEFLSTGPKDWQGNDYLGATPYEYTGETLEIFDKTYYIWINNGDNSLIHNLLTTTIDFDELREESLLVNPEIQKSPSLVAIVSEDTDLVYVTPEEEFELIVKVEKI